MKLSFTTLPLASAIALALLANSTQAQFQWAKRLASATSLPSDVPDIGMALDSQDNLYVTAWFDGTSDFGGVTLTNQSAGGSDIFVAKYNSTGTLQWARRAGGSDAGVNTGRGAGVDNGGNVYVTGGFYGPADFGSVNLDSDGVEEMFLTKYDNAGDVQWVQQSFGGVSGLGLAVDGAGNSYAIAFGGFGGATISFGSVNLDMPDGYDESTFLVKYDNTGAVQWAKLIGGTAEVYATKVAVDGGGNVFLRGTFGSKNASGANMTIGTSTLVVSAGSKKNMFIAKFDSSGTLTWVQQPTGGNVDEGGVAVDQNGDVYVTGFLSSTVNFGAVSLKFAGIDSAFLAKYNSAGAIQWARQAGTAGLNWYLDVAVDGQGNVYPAGVLSPNATAGSGLAAAAKYDASGTLQWAYSASGRPANMLSSAVSKCAVDSAGNCYVAGFYQGTGTFGATALPAQGTWNFFLAKVEGPAPKTVITTTDYPTGAGTSSAKISGANVTLTAKASAGAAFLDWTSNGVVLSTKSPYTFTVSGSETVVANFGYSVTTTSSPAAGGTTGGAGLYQTGQSVTVTANPNGCYDFASWTKHSKLVSTEPGYTFTVSSGDVLVANFKLKEDIIATLVNPPKSGTTTGQGSYGCGKTVTLRATAAAGYKFLFWTVGAPIQTASNPYRFSAESSEAWTANFSDVSVPTVAITSPTAKQKVDATLLTVSGTAKNVLGVGTVNLTVNGNRVPASTANHWTNWSASVMLSPGANVISAVALSEAGNPSKAATVTFENTATGEAPVALAGLVGYVQIGNNAPFQVSFGSATFEQFSADPNQGSSVSYYTYTQTGPNTATFITTPLAPPSQSGTGGAQFTFTSPTAATFSDGNGNTGTLTLSAGLNLDVSSISGWTITSVDASSNTFTTTFGDGTFTSTDSNGADTSGSYASMQYGPMATMVMETYTDPSNGNLATNYYMVTFTSPGNGSFFSTAYDGAGGGPYYDSGTFTGAYQASGLRYLAPASLNGMSVTVTPLQKANNPGPAIASCGQATLATTYPSTKGSSKVAGYTYARTGADTAVLIVQTFAPPSSDSTSDNSDTLNVTFTSATSATYTNPNGDYGKMTFARLSPSGYFAPAALAQGTLQGKLNGESGSISLNYGNFTKSGGSGTFTYAQFSPTVGMLIMTDTDSSAADEVDYAQLTFNGPSGGSAAGDLYSTKAGTAKLGTFSLVK
ncbi:MAG TPA: hypothetical protein VFC44_18935 [Candidatus Saccharimonadales bacterium]|nr:hypothetical protein [Candidatus Saccharimonadales bacterium]